MHEVATVWLIYVKALCEYSWPASVHMSPLLARSHVAETQASTENEKKACVCACISVWRQEEAQYYIGHVIYGGLAVCSTDQLVCSTLAQRLFEKESKLTNDPLSGVPFPPKVWMFVYIRMQELPLHFLLLIESAGMNYVCNACSCCENLYLSRAYMSIYSCLPWNQIHMDVIACIWSAFGCDLHFQAVYTGILGIFRTQTMCPVRVYINLGHDFLECWVEVVIIWSENDDGSRHRRVIGC